MSLLRHLGPARLLTNLSYLHDNSMVSQRRLTAWYLLHPAVGEVAALLEQGQLNRKIGETMMNSESSRSHSVFTAVLECKTTDDSGITHVLSSRLNLVDLAGARLAAVVLCARCIAPVGASAPVLSPLQCNLSVTTRLQSPLHREPPERATVNDTMSKQPGNHVQAASGSGSRGRRGSG
jgi:Kinesin motor domain